MTGPSPDPGLDRLVRIVVEDGEARARRARERTRSEARQLVIDAEARIDDLRQAALALGHTRGSAAAEAIEREADREVAAVVASAFDALATRFARHVELAIGDLPKDEARYAEALAAWARHATAELDGPTEVFAGRRDRVAVYEALVAAGAEDFQVLADAQVHVGFVARDLDGRTRYDCRPAALVARNREALVSHLEAAAPPFEPPAGAAAGPEAAAEAPAASAPAAP